MGSEGGDVVTSSLMIERLPQDQQFDGDGIPVAEPMFRMTMINGGIAISRTGNEVYFRNLVSAINDCLDGKMRATTLTEIKAG